jgi:hypothetical protein
VKKILFTGLFSIAALFVSLAAENFFDFNFTLWPNSIGSLDGRGDISLRWLPWLGTEASVYTDNRVRVADTATDASTAKTASVTGDLYPVKINEELLWSILKKKLDWLAFSAALGARITWEKTNSYGYDPTTYVFRIADTTGTLFTVPLRLTLGLRFPKVDFTAFFENTMPLFGMGGLFPTVTNYDTQTSAIDSATNALASSAIRYELTSTRWGGELGIDLRYVQPILGFENYHYTQGVGPNFLNVIGRDVNTYTGNLTLSFIKESWGSPMIGFSYVSYYDFAQNVELSRQYRVNFGIR